MIKVTTHPFGQFSAQQRGILEQWGPVEYNETGRRLTEADLLPFVGDATAIVAGTEQYSRAVLEQCPNLKVISRVGTGFDNVDLGYCRGRGILVAYTPEAPADSVAEMAVAQMINMIRRIPDSGREIERGKWNRLIGRQLGKMTVGILGVGRIGGRVAGLLEPFGCRLYGCDIDDGLWYYGVHRIVDKLARMNQHELFANCDIITVHVPLNERNHYLVGSKEIGAMLGGYLVNNSRGAVVDEAAVVEGLIVGDLNSYAADVFETEPYAGPLVGMPGAYLTAHMGSSTAEARNAMELGAARNCINALTGGSYEEVPYDSE